MHTWITEFEYSILFFSGLTFLFAAPFISHQYSRFGRFAGWPAFVSAAVVLYGTSLIAFTLFPFPNFAGDFCAKHADRSKWQVMPLESLNDVTEHASSHTLVETLTSGVFLQVVMNVVFFLPLGFFLAYRSRRSLPTTTAIAFAVSLSIELTQGTGLWGLAPCPYRLADIDDLMTNTAGGVIGWFVGVGLRRVLPDPTPRRQPDPGPPGLVREGVGVLLDVYVYLLLLVVGIFALRATGLASSVPQFEVVLATILVTLVLFVLIPALRRDRAGPGVASVHMVLVDARDGTSPAPRWSLVVRWIIRWLPVAFLGVGWLLFIVVVDFLVGGLSPTRRSLNMRLTRTAYATREHFRGDSDAGANRSDAESGTP